MAQFRFNLVTSHERWRRIRDLETESNGDLLSPDRSLVAKWLMERHRRWDFDGRADGKPPLISPAPEWIGMDAALRAWSSDNRRFFFTIPLGPYSMIFSISVDGGGDAFEGLVPEGEKWEDGSMRRVVKKAK